MKKCRYHCGSCHSHFTSLVAFDAHRLGPHSGDRVCWGDSEPEELSLRAMNEPGRCEMYDVPVEPVTLYEHGPRADALRAHYGRSRASDEAEKGV